MGRDQVAAALRLRGLRVVPKPLGGEEHAEGARVRELVLPLEALARAVGQLRVEGSEAVEELPVRWPRKIDFSVVTLNDFPNRRGRAQKKNVLPGLVMSRCRCAVLST